MHLQERVEAELKKLMDQKHINKLDKYSDRQIFSPIVITVKKDQTVKLALDSKKINNIIHKHKYQMPNIILLLDKIHRRSNRTNPNKRYFPHSIFATYNHKPLWLKRPDNNAISVLLVATPLGHINSKQDSTDTPPEFRKAINLTLTSYTKIFAYLDDILIVTKGSVKLQRQKLQAVLTKLDEKNLAISLDKCKFACKQIERLGFNINSEGTKPLIKNWDYWKTITTKNF